MENDSSRKSGKIAPANDNRGPDAETWRKVDAVAMRLATIIGRRMAREDFGRLRAANDNRLLETGNTEDGADSADSD